MAATAAALMIGSGRLDFRLVLRKRVGCQRHSLAIAFLLFAPSIGLGQDSSGQRDIPSLFAQVQAQFAENRLKEAEAGIKRILELAPNNAGVHANLGILYFRQGYYEKAAEAFEKAVELHSQLRNARLFLGLSKLGLGRAGEALPHLEKGFWNADSDDWRRKAGLIVAEHAVARGNHGNALRVLQELRDSYPDDDDVLYLSYRLHSDLAARAVSALVAKGPSSARVQQVTAELHESEGDYTAAADAYRKALELDPNLPGIHRALGVALLNRGRDEATRREAEIHFRRELDRNPGDAIAEYQLGEIAGWRNDWEASLRHLTRAAELQPDLIDAQLALAKIWIARGDPKKALDYLDRAEEIDRLNEVVHYRRAQAHRKLGQRDQASRSLAEFRRLREARSEASAVFRQVSGARNTNQTVDEGAPPP